LSRSIGPFDLRVFLESYGFYRVSGFTISKRGEDSMKKQFVLFIAAIFTFAMVSSAYAAKKKPECPQPRKTKSAPASTVKQDKTK